MRSRGNHPYSSIKTAITACVAALFIITLAGCAAPQPIEKLPSLDDIHHARHPNDEGQPNATVTGLRIQTISLRLGASTDAAWAALSTQGLDHDMIRRWRNNGFRIGTLARDDVAQWSTLLSHAYAQRAELYVPTEYDLPLRHVPAQTKPREVLVDLPPNPPRIVTLPPGQSQFLITFTSPENHGEPLPLSILPHHHIARPHLTPRHPFELATDGIALTMLKVNTLLPDDRVLIIGLDPEPIVTWTRPTRTKDMDSSKLPRLDDSTDTNTDANKNQKIKTLAEPQTDTNATTDKNTANNVDEVVDITAPPTPPTPTTPTTPTTVPTIPRLGTLWLTAPHSKRPSQRMIMIAAQPIPTTTPQQSHN